MSKTKTYQLLTLCYVVQYSKDFGHIYCESVEIAKAEAAIWIYQKAGAPFQLKWEDYGNNRHGAWIPHDAHHELRSLGFNIKPCEIEIADVIEPTCPGGITPAWVDATHQYDYGNIEIKCPTCGNADKEIEVSSVQTSPDHFTHIVEQVDTKCNKCGARWALNRDGSHSVNLR